MKITTGVKIPVERDGEPVGEIKFNPTDVVFAEKVYGLIGRYTEKQAEYEKRAADLDASDETDKYGLPKKHG